MLNFQKMAPAIAAVSNGWTVLEAVEGLRPSLRFAKAATSFLPPAVNEPALEEAAPPALALLFAPTRTDLVCYAALEAEGSTQKFIPPDASPQHEKILPMQLPVP